MYGWWMVAVQAFNGAGDTVTPTRISLVFFWLIQIPLSYALAVPLGWQHTGVFWGVFGPGAGWPHPPAHGTLRSMAGTRTAPTHLRIDFVSDVVCPWCAVGLASLEQALERVRGEIEADIHFQPFELNPQLGPEGEDAVEHVKKKYGMADAQVAVNQEAIRKRGAELGFTFDMARRRHVHNTFDAHRLLHWAGAEGRQRELKHALLRAYFTDGRNVADHDTLVDIAAAVGLAAADAREILASEAYAGEVRADEQYFLDAGIHAVPAVIIERKHLVSGGQPVEVFAQALRQVAAAKRG